MKLQLTTVVLLAGTMLAHAGDRLDGIVKCAKAAKNDNAKVEKCLTENEAHSLMEARFLLGWITSLCKGQDLERVGNFLVAMGDTDPYGLTNYDMKMREDKKIIVRALDERRHNNPSDQSVKDWCSGIAAKYGPSGSEWPGLYDPNPKPKNSEPKEAVGTSIFLEDNEVRKFLFDKVKDEPKIGVWKNSGELSVITKYKGEYALTSLNPGGKSTYDHVPLKAEVPGVGMSASFSMKYNGELDYLFIRASDRCAVVVGEDDAAQGYSDRELCYMTPKGDFPVGAAAGSSSAQ